MRDHGELEPRYGATVCVRDRDGETRSSLHTDLDDLLRALRWCRGESMNALDDECRPGDTVEGLVARWSEGKWTTVYGVRLEPTAWMWTDHGEDVHLSYPEDVPEEEDIEASLYEYSLLDYAYREDAGRDDMLSSGVELFGAYSRNMPEHWTTARTCEWARWIWGSLDHVKK